MSLVPDDTLDQLIELSKKSLFSGHKKSVAGYAKRGDTAASGRLAAGGPELSQLKFFY
jgi:hypothetical protein